MSLDGTVAYMNAKHPVQKQPLAAEFILTDDILETLTKQWFPDNHVEEKHQIDRKEEKKSALPSDSTSLDPALVQKRKVALELLKIQRDKILAYPPELLSQENKAKAFALVLAQVYFSLANLNSPVAQKPSDEDQAWVWMQAQLVLVCNDSTEVKALAFNSDQAKKVEDYLEEFKGELGINPQLMGDNDLSGFADGQDFNSFNFFQETKKATESKQTLKTYNIPFKSTFPKLNYVEILQKIFRISQSVENSFKNHSDDKKLDRVDEPLPTDFKWETIDSQNFLNFVEKGGKCPDATFTTFNFDSRKNILDSYQSLIETARNISERQSIWPWYRNKNKRIQEAFDKLKAARTHCEPQLALASFQSKDSEPVLAVDIIILLNVVEKLLDYHLKIHSFWRGLWTDSNRKTALDELLPLVKNYITDPTDQQNFFQFNTTVVKWKDILKNESNSELNKILGHICEISEDKKQVSISEEITAARKFRESVIDNSVTRENIRKLRELGNSINNLDSKTSDEFINQYKAWEPQNLKFVSAKKILLLKAFCKLNTGSGKIFDLMKTFYLGDLNQLYDNDTKQFKIQTDHGAYVVTLDEIFNSVLEIFLEKLRNDQPTKDLWKFNFITWVIAKKAEVEHPLQLSVLFIDNLKRDRQCWPLLQQFYKDQIQESKSDIPNHDRIDYWMQLSDENKLILKDAKLADYSVLQLQKIIACEQEFLRIQKNINELKEDKTIISNDSEGVVTNLRSQANAKLETSKKGLNSDWDTLHKEFHHNKNNNHLSEKLEEDQEAKIISYAGLKNINARVDIIWKNYQFIIALLSDVGGDAKHWIGVSLDDQSFYFVGLAHFFQDMNETILNKLHRLENVKKLISEQKDQKDLNNHQKELFEVSVKGHVRSRIGFELSQIPAPVDDKKTEEIMPFDTDQTKKIERLIALYFKNIILEDQSIQLKQLIEDNEVLRKLINYYFFKENINANDQEVIQKILLNKNLIKDVCGDGFKLPDNFSWQDLSAVLHLINAVKSINTPFAWRYIGLMFKVLPDNISTINNLKHLYNHSYRYKLTYLPLETSTAEFKTFLTEYNDFINNYGSHKKTLADCKFTLISEQKNNSRDLRSVLFKCLFSSSIDEFFAYQISPSEFAMFSSTHKEIQEKIAFILYLKRKSLKTYDLDFTLNNDDFYLSWVTQFLSDSESEEMSKKLILKECYEKLPNILLLKTKIARLQDGLLQQCDRQRIYHEIHVPLTKAVDVDDKDDKDKKNELRRIKAALINSLNIITVPQLESYLQCDYKIEIREDPSANKYLFKFLFDDQYLVKEKLSSTLIIKTLLKHNLQACNYLMGELDDQLLENLRKKNHWLSIFVISRYLHPAAEIKLTDMQLKKIRFYQNLHPKGLREKFHLDLSNDADYMKILLDTLLKDSSAQWDFNTCQIPADVLDEKQKLNLRIVSLPGIRELKESKSVQEFIKNPDPVALLGSLWSQGLWPVVWVAQAVIEPSKILNKSQITNLNIAHFIRDSKDHKEIENNDSVKNFALDSDPAAFIKALCDEGLWSLALKIYTQFENQIKLKNNQILNLKITPLIQKYKETKEESKDNQQVGTKSFDNFTFESDIVSFIKALWNEGRWSLILKLYEGFTSSIENEVLRENITYIKNEIKNKDNFWNLNFNIDQEIIIGLLKMQDLSQGNFQSIASLKIELIIEFRKLFLKRKGEIFSHCCPEISKDECWNNVFNFLHYKNAVEGNEKFQTLITDAALSDLEEIKVAFGEYNKYLDKYQEIAVFLKNTKDKIAKYKLAFTSEQKVHFSISDEKNQAEINEWLGSLTVYSAFLHKQTTLSGLIKIESYILNLNDKIKFYELLKDDSIAERIIRNSASNLPKLDSPSFYQDWIDLYIGKYLENIRDQDKKFDDFKKLSEFFGRIINALSNDSEKQKINTYLTGCLESLSSRVQAHYSPALDLLNEQKAFPAFLGKDNSHLFENFLKYLTFLSSFNSADNQDSKSYLKNQGGFIQAVFKTFNTFISPQEFKDYLQDNDSDFIKENALKNWNNFINKLQDFEVLRTDFNNQEIFLLSEFKKIKDEFRDCNDYVDKYHIILLTFKNIHKKIVNYKLFFNANNIDEKDHLEINNLLVDAKPQFNLFLKKKNTLADLAKIKDYFSNLNDKILFFAALKKDKFSQGIINGLPSLNSPKFYEECIELYIAKYLENLRDQGKKIHDPDQKFNGLANLKGALDGVIDTISNSSVKNAMKDYLKESLGSLPSKAQVHYSSTLELLTEQKAFAAFLTTNQNHLFATFIKRIVFLSSFNSTEDKDSKCLVKQGEFIQGIFNAFNSFVSSQTFKEYLHNNNIYFVKENCLKNWNDFIDKLKDFEVLRSESISQEISLNDFKALIYSQFLSFALIRMDAVIKLLKSGFMGNGQDSKTLYNILFKYQGEIDNIAKFINAIPNPDNYLNIEIVSADSKREGDKQTCSNAVSSQLKPLTDILANVAKIANGNYETESKSLDTTGLKYRLFSALNVDQRTDSQLVSDTINDISKNIDKIKLKFGIELSEIPAPQQQSSSPRLFNVESKPTSLAAVNLSNLTNTNLPRAIPVNQSTLPNPIHNSSTENPNQTSLQS